MNILEEHKLGDYKFGISCPSYKRQFDSIKELIEDLIDSGFGFSYYIVFDNEETEDELDEVIAEYYMDLIN